MNDRRKLFGKTERIHFIGIGGSGMNGIAQIILNLGYDVQGSDVMESDTTKRLERMGAKIFIGHNADNILGADVVVYSSAVESQNPEMRKAQSLHIPIIPRAEMLAELMRLKRGIAVAGTHGKTTTSALIGNIFNEAKLRPTTIIGGKVFNIGANAILGKGDFLICEADESDGSFLKLSPEAIIVTNIDNDHLDYYIHMNHLKKAFVDFINKIPFYGLAVVCLDDKNISSLRPEIHRKIITYGFHREADFVIKKSDHLTFNLLYKNKSFSNIKMNKPGAHNMQNTAAAVITSLEFNLPYHKIIKGVSSFKGVERRMEYLGTVNGIKIMDDYGHHPTEIKATLEALTSMNDYKKLIVIFQPHRYSRTKILHHEFGDAFRKADIVIVTDIYSAGEKKIPGITGELIYHSILKEKKRETYFIPDKKDIIKKLFEMGDPGDLILTLGAGDIKFLGPELLEELK